MTLSFLVTLVFGLGLLFRGERVASLVDLPPLAVDDVAMDSEMLLRVGVLVAGLLVACNVLPKAVLSASALILNPHTDSWVSMYPVDRTRLLESAIQVFLAWLLVFRSAQITRFISSHGGTSRADSPAAEQGASADARDSARR
jgi:hypothetical protein